MVIMMLPGVYGGFKEWLTHFLHIENTSLHGALPNSEELVPLKGQSGSSIFDESTLLEVVDLKSFLWMVNNLSVTEPFFGGVLVFCFPSS